MSSPMCCNAGPNLLAKSQVTKPRIVRRFAITKRPGRRGAIPGTVALYSEIAPQTTTRAQALRCGTTLSETAPVADQWRRIGVETEHLQVETGLYFATRERRDFDVIMQNVS